MCRMFCSASEACTMWTMRNDEILDGMRKERFDLAVIDSLFFFKCIYLIPHRLQVPWIAYSRDVDPLIARVPWLPSFVPIEFLSYTETMTFPQRLANTAAMFAFSLVFSHVSFNPPSDVIDKYQQYGSFSSLSELMPRTSLWFHTNTTNDAERNRRWRTDGKTR